MRILAFLDDGTAAAGRGRVILLAVLLDLLLGEPPNWCHPVVAMGKLVAALERRSPRGGRVLQLAYGALAEAACLAMATLPGSWLERLFRPDSLHGALILAAALKPTFAVRALFEHQSAILTPLEKGDLPAARSAVGRIVSRDVRHLDEGQVAAAAIESLAENASDAVVAPLLCYALFGLRGAYAYRMANTLDAMWGYRGAYEYLGRVAAKLDDLLNLVPSRLTALAIAACSSGGGAPWVAWRVARRDASKTASPNAGWPMAAVAGALGVRLEKVDHYALNEEGRTPEARDLSRAQTAVGAGLVASVAVLLLFVGLRRSLIRQDSVRQSD